MKPVSTILTHGWCCAVWTPVFSTFLHRFLRADDTRRKLGKLASKATISAETSRWVSCCRLPSKKGCRCRA